jgi:arylsulfatase A-like enzyme
MSVFLTVRPIAGVACIALLVAACGREPGSAAAPATVVLVTVDTLRADRVSFDRYALPTTPFLASLAADGVVFEQAYAPSSWTPPSMASLFTSVYPTTHGITSGGIRQGGAHRQPILDKRFVTLAELAREAGYVTIGVPANRHLTEELGFGQGFDHYFGEANFLKASEVNREVVRQMQAAFGPNWRHERKRHKLFLWVHYFDPHDPYLPYEPWTRVYDPDFRHDDPHTPAFKIMKELKKRYPEVTPELRAQIGRLYDAEIRRFDDHFAVLWQQLGLGDETLLVMTADHGEAIGERGLLGHSHSLHEELIHVPFLARWPERIPRGLRIDEPVGILDIYPTLAALMGMPIPETARGRSLVPFFEENSDTSAQARTVPLYYELHRPRTPTTGLRSGRWKLLVERRKRGERRRLFDLEADRGELRDVSAEHPEVLEQLTAQAAAWREELEQGEAETRELTDPETLEQLRAMGYVE